MVLTFSFQLWNGKAFANKIKWPKHKICAIIFMTPQEPFFPECTFSSVILSIKETTRAWNIPAINLSFLLNYKRIPFTHMTTLRITSLAIISLLILLFPSTAIKKWHQIILHITDNSFSIWQKLCWFTSSLSDTSFDQLSPKRCLMSLSQGSLIKIWELDDSEMTVAQNARCIRGV